MKRRLAFVSLCFAALLAGGVAFTADSAEETMDLTSSLARYDIEAEAAWSMVPLPEDYGIFAVGEDGSLVRINHAGVMTRVEEMSDLPPVRRFILFLPGVTGADVMGFSQREHLVARFRGSDPALAMDAEFVDRFARSMANLHFGGGWDRERIAVDIGPVAGNEEMLRLTARDPLEPGLYSLFVPIGPGGGSGLFVAPFSIQRREMQEAREAFLATEEGQAVVVANRVARARADMRSLATAIESYHVDMNTYPAHTTDFTNSINARFGEQLQHFPGAGRPTFRRSAPRPGGDGLVQDPMQRAPQPGAARLMSLTTPIAYFASYPADPFSPVEGATYNYFNAALPGSAGGSTKGWIIWSPGPNGSYDLPLEAYDPRLPVEEILRRLAPFSYDPTNGLLSPGDLWRIRQ